MAATLHVETYKTVGQDSLEIRIWEPDNTQYTDPRPAMIFFHGGGFVSGNLFQLYQQALHFANLGIITACVQYRLCTAGSGVTLDDVWEDAVDAYDWFYGWKTAHNADVRFGTCGASAGGAIAGKLASYTASDLCCLFNPVLDMGPDGGYGYSIAGADWRDWSTAYLDSPYCPTLVMQGDADTTALVGFARAYRNRSFNLVKLVEYAGQEHSFFNYKMPPLPDGENPYYQQTLAEMELFLRYHGWIA